ncbi:hypothetical protein IW261DRAFT_1557699 [Armillaria novae-zelandiae]|uniref:XPG-I domain-containing protein n=1 Tax=Armillaria novae-zelandiae TaxID=153914 RepID=A0AA39PRH8_9AGAR|nr:hypothetical protein IW261DRAFT_1557699 [Armillaria novae-zelandiae]
METVADNYICSLHACPRNVAPCTLVYAPIEPIQVWYTVRDRARVCARVEDIAAGDRDSTTGMGWILTWGGSVWWMEGSGSRREVIYQTRGLMQAGAVSKEELEADSDSRCGFAHCRTWREDVDFGEGEHMHRRYSVGHPVLVLESLNTPASLRVHGMALCYSIKRGKKVRTRAPWLEKHFKEMIRAFGFYYHDAPGEAEAELAAMNKAGIIDMIITEDSDALVFGGMCILRRLPRSKGDNGKKIKIDPDEYVLYSSKHILAQDNVRLTEGGLFLLAILLGGDYDGNKGLSGCGQKTAHMLALTGLGDSLYLAVKTMDNSELQKYLTVWRDMLCSELLQPSIPGASKHPSLANKIPVAFPNMKILKYYAQPITSWHAGFEQRVVASAWEVPLPDIALISDFCSRFFHWDSDVLLQRLRKNIWPGIIVQSLYRLGNHAFATLPKSRINTLHCISDGSLANHSIQSITTCAISPPTYTV